MRFLAFLPLALPLLAQDHFRVELTAAAWQTRIEGTLQAAGLPIDLRSDLALDDRTIFFGRLVAKPGRRHRLIIEGSPYSFAGVNTVSRAITFQGQTFTVNDTLQSSATLDYVYGGYQFDIISASRGHFGFQAGAAYLNATGTINSATRGITATRSQKIGLPLAGAGFRVWPLRFLNITGGVKGMSLGGYGHFVQGEIGAGVGIRFITFQAGYQIVDADVHENTGTAGRPGIAPRIQGPIFAIQLRY